jgi:DNA-directed RNA polymerase specialized sigma54-like protein
MKLNLSLSPQMQQNLSLTITQVLSPRMLQMLKTLNLSYTDLLDKIKAESENNPLLEVTRSDELVAFAKELHSSRTQVASLADYDPDAPAQDFKGNTTSLTEHLLGQLKLENLSQADFEMASLRVPGFESRATNYPHACAPH